MGWLFAAIACLALAPAGAHAAGFALVDQGGRAQGSAYAGEAAIAEDATTITFNPAGMTRLPGGQIVLSGHVLSLNLAFEDRGSTVARRFGGEPLHGERDASSDAIGFAPNLDVSYRLSERWWIGLGVLAPFGFRTEYDSDWVGRYHAIESDMKMVEVAPTVAVKLLDGLSFGASLAIQYAHIRLSSALDLGAVCEDNLATLGLPPGTCATIGLPVQEVDGFVKLTTSSWGVGYNLGFLYEFTSHTRVGLSYRSMVRHQFEGEAKFTIPKQAEVLQSTGALRDTGAQFTIDLPEVVRLGVYHELGPRVAAMAGIEWTNWSRFASIPTTFDNPAQPPIVQPEEWRDAFRYAVGGAYRPTPRWILQLGGAYDETPVPSPQLRTARIPDADRVWITAGIGHRLTDTLRFDVSYAHLFAPTVSIDNRDPVSGAVLRGRYEGSANILGLQATWAFQ